MSSSSRSCGVLLALGLWGAGGVAQAEESAPGCTLGELEAALELGPEAFSRRDDDAFQAARAQATETLGCLEVTVTPALAADLHQLMALSFFRDMDDAAATRSMQALLLHLPYYRFGPPTVTAGQAPLNALLEQAKVAPPGRPITVDMPRGAVLRVDGVRAEERQSGLPAVVQVVSEQGEVLWGGYVLPEDPLPPLDLPPVARGPREQLTRGLLIGGGAVALGGAASLSAGVALAGQREALGGRVIQSDDSLNAADAQRYDQLYARSNALGLAGQGALMAGAALGGLGLVLAL